MVNPRDELDRNDDMDDDIREAMYDAACDAEGTLSPRYLRYHLAKRGLKIIEAPNGR